MVRFLPLLGYLFLAQKCADLHHDFINLSPDNEKSFWKTCLLKEPKYWHKCGLDYVGTVLLLKIFALPTPLLCHYVEIGH